METKLGQIIFVAVVAVIACYAFSYGVKTDAKTLVNDGYHAVKIGDETFYEKDEDSNYIIEGVVSKDGTFLSDPVIDLSIKNDSGKSEKLAITDVDDFVIDDGIEQSYVRKVVTADNRTKYYAYLTTSDEKQLTELVASKYGLEVTVLGE